MINIKHSNYPLYWNLSEPLSCTFAEKNNLNCAQYYDYIHEYGHIFNVKQIRALHLLQKNISYRIILFKKS